MRSALALLLLSVPVSAHAQSPERPSWGASLGVGVGTGGGLVLGAVAGQLLPVGEARWMTLLAGAGAGAWGGTHAAQRVLGLRPDVRGALAGGAVGGLAGGWAMSRGREGQSVLWGMGGVLVGATLGHRYFYTPRTSSTVLLPTATPYGPGVAASFLF